MKTLGCAELGAYTFCAASYSNDQCGPNGLPLTPNSIRILGRSQKLKTIEHPRLCKYLDFVRGKHERLTVVSEHYRQKVGDWIQLSHAVEYDRLIQLAYEVLEGLAYLNTEDIVSRNLSPKNILLDLEGHVKLTKYGMYHMTRHGMDVSFPVGDPRYMAPEVLGEGPVETVSGSDDQRALVSPPSAPKVDVWSLGVILLEVCLGKQLWPTLTLQQVFYKILSFCTSELEAYNVIVHDHQGKEREKEIPDELKEFIKLCITVSPTKRQSPVELLYHTLFKDLREKQTPYQNGFSMFSTELRCKDLEIPEYDETIIEDETDYLAERSIDEVYYLWRLAGGDVEGILKKAGLIRCRPPITKLASFVIHNGELFGEKKDRSVLLDDTIVILSLDQLRQRLENIDAAAYYPLLEDESSAAANLPTSPSSQDLTDTSKLPLVIKERDIEYQFHRIILYERLLKAYPYKRADIWKEARVDIPPLVRGHVWAAVLDVEGDVFGRYDAIDKETPIPTDRQIEVDIPRCHQYNALLSSPEGHRKFKRILKAWVVSNPQYVYWQGLDSLCAPFLYLNFNSEAVAFACLSAFIPKYLHKFFLKDNSAVIQEYLAVFSHLIAFHEPELNNHLDGIGFIPDLYAIPWFLTMYAHVFPLHKIFHLWDTLLLGSSSFPLCIGVAILQQLRDKLLASDFNECILLFSDMPEIDIEICVQDSIKVFRYTPKSATYRQHARPPKKLEDKSTKPNVSYYSSEYNEGSKSDLSMEPLTIEELKLEKCPRVSAEDLIAISELRGHSLSCSPTKHNKSVKPKLLIIDIRSQEEYIRGTVPGSINIPFGTAFSPEGSLVPCPAVQTLNQHKNQVKVVLGSRGKNAIHFSEILVNLEYSKVCVLHKGIEGLRPTGLLTVPPADI